MEKPIDLTDAVARAHRLLEQVSTALEAQGKSVDHATRFTLTKSQEILSRLDVRPLSSTLHATSVATALAIDVSDLLGYLATNRLPTGIQRVQIELVRNMMADHPDTGVCCFDESRLEWVSVDVVLFLKLCDQSCSGGDAQEANWVATVREMQGQVDSAPPAVFQDGGVLINVGTSWWLPNYFLYVRQLKSKYNVRYVPLVYDLIPILMPQYCNIELVEEFIDWFFGVLNHSDFFLAISEATKRDIIALSNAIGRPISPDRIEVVALDANFKGASKERAGIFRRFSDPYVLFVSTIEARKNQIGALDAWATLLARYGANKIPRLVLVGKFGFQSDLVRSRLDNNADLREKVSILSGIEDSELQALYDNCAFTIYPSLYEGWGLPITESLSHGKVPLVADNSSLPEAGGACALYFPTSSSVGLVSELERLIFDSSYRIRQEATIREHFHPRSWAAIAHELYSHVDRWVSGTTISAWHPPVVRTGAYYPMSRNRSVRVWSGKGSAEVFRDGLGWYRLEDIGCWIRSTGADLAMRLEAGSARIGFQLVGAPDTKARYRITVSGQPMVAIGLIEGQITQWAFLDITDALIGSNVIFHIDAEILSKSRHGNNVDHRPLSVALAGFFVVGSEMGDRIEFLEAVTLGAIGNLDAYRDVSAFDAVM